jgi:hypothetical protein
MSLDYAGEKFGTAISILASGKDRVLDRLRSAYLESLMRVGRDDIPKDLLSSYDSLTARLSWITDETAPPSEDEAMQIVTSIEDLSALLDSRIEQQ